MPRTRRVVLSNHPHHVIHKGHNGDAVFENVGDRQFYLDTLAALKLELNCRLLSYCLMTNHVHLIIDPGDDCGRLGRLMQRLAGRYTCFFNRVKDRSGTVWNGRFRSSPVQTESYLMRCCRYVDLNPVRAGIVATPDQYRWSSYNEKTGRQPPWLIDEDACYRRLGQTLPERQRSYGRWVHAAVGRDEEQAIRAAVRRSLLTGDRGFVDQVEREVGRRIEPKRRGRPAGPG